MAEIVNIRDAKTSLSRLIERTICGEDIVIARAGKPLVRLTPIEPIGPRVPGLLKGLVIPDELFAPMTEEELADWE